MTDTPAEFAGRMDRLARQFDERAMTTLASTLGMSAKDDAAEGFKADLGRDLRMSNFPNRRKPMTLTARFDVVSPGVVEVTPSKAARGPIKMLEVGRRPARAGDVRIDILGAGYGAGGAMLGPKIRRRKTKRNVGPMAPKGTWSDAAEVIWRRYPSRLQDATRKAIRKGLGG